MNAHKKEIEVSEADYEEWLDEVYGQVDICGNTYNTSYILREIDPTSYNVGFTDYRVGVLYEAGDAWICSNCNEEFDNEEEAHNCCTDQQKDLTYITQ